MRFLCECINPPKLILISIRIISFYNFYDILNRGHMAFGIGYLVSGISYLVSGILFGWFL